MNIFKILKSLFHRRKIKEETRTLQNSGQVIDEIKSTPGCICDSCLPLQPKLNPQDSYLCIAGYLNHLVSTKQIKNYKMIQWYVGELCNEQDHLNYDELTPNDQLLTLAKQAKTLHYKCADQKFLDWLMSYA